MRIFTTYYTCIYLHIIYLYTQIMTRHSAHNPCLHYTNSFPHILLPLPIQSNTKKSFLVHPRFRLQKIYKIMSPNTKEVNASDKATATNGTAKKSVSFNSIDTNKPDNKNHLLTQLLDNEGTYDNLYNIATTEKGFTTHNDIKGPRKELHEGNLNQLKQLDNEEANLANPPPVFDKLGFNTLHPIQSLLLTLLSSVGTALLELDQITISNAIIRMHRETKAECWRTTRLMS